MPKRVCDRAVWSVFPHKCNHKSPSLPGSLLNQCDIALNGNRELPLFRREQSYDICANLRKKMTAAAAAAGVGVTAAGNNNNNTNTNTADPPGGVTITQTRHQTPVAVLGPRTITRITRTRHQTPVASPIRAVARPRHQTPRPILPVVWPRPLPVVVPRTLIVIPPVARTCSVLCCRGPSRGWSQNKKQQQK